MADTDVRGLFTGFEEGGTGTTPGDARRALGGLLAHGGAGGLNVRTGVLVDDMTPVVSGTGSMAVSVRPFRAVTKYANSNGVSVSTLGTTLSLGVPVAPGSGSRIDIAYAKQRLLTADGGDSSSRNDLEVGVVSGSPSGSPTAPSIPAGAIELSRWTVSSGTIATNSLTFGAPQWTVANGGIIPSGIPGRGSFWDGSAWASVATETSGLIGVGGAWSPASGAPPYWIRIGSMVHLGGAAIRSSTIPDSSYMTLSGIPAPADASAWAGVVANGDGRVLAARLTSDRVLTWYQKIGSGSSTYIWYSSISYRAAP